VGPLVNPEGGAFDPLESYLGEGRVFDFPKNDNCETVYCNIEGVAWVTDNMVSPRRLALCVAIQSH
jgi:hypothetical protein